MTNITLSIEDGIHKRMRKHSEIKWSEFVRKAIKKRLDELEKINSEEKESILSMIASEDVLKKEGLNEADERWNEL